MRDVDISEPLAGLVRCCETFCLRACCGIDALDPNASQVAEWVEIAGRESARAVIPQLDEIAELARDPEVRVRSFHLNHFTVSSEARTELLELVAELRRGVEEALSETR